MMNQTLRHRLIKAMPIQPVLCRGIGAVLMVLAAALTGTPNSASAQQITNTQSFSDPGFYWSRAWVDFNNDGRSDFCRLVGGSADSLSCYASNGRTFEGTPQVFGVGVTAKDFFPFWVDVNGDGRVDLCKLHHLDGRYGFQCRLGSTFAASSYYLEIPGGAPDQYDWDGRLVLPGRDGLRFADKDLFMADLNGDGRSDVCYLHLPKEAEPTAGELRCFLSADGAIAQSSAWSRANVAVGVLDRSWPREFIDFNGDGFTDFCRVLDGGSVRCTLGSAGGFQGEITMPPVAAPYARGATFIDFNGDGKSDFCRPAGSGTTTHLRCSLSDGIGWHPVELISPPLNLGHDRGRWWVDINSDGYPDYCRALSDPNVAPATFACRLGRGDGDPPASQGTSTYAFPVNDVQVANVGFGVIDGGRSFCDARGVGVQTLCRMTTKQVPGEPYCTGWGEPQQCQPTTTTVYDLLAGITSDVQADHPLLLSVNGGVGSETRVSYAPMSDPEVYTRSGFGSYPRALVALSTQPLVQETRAWDTGSTPTTLTGNARYFYKDLRVDNQAGSRGFRERWMFSEGTNTMDHTVFFQGLGPTVDPSSRENDPLEIGLVKMQERYLVKGGIQPTPGNAGEADSARRQALRTVTRQSTSQNSADQGYTLPSEFSLLERTVNTLSDTTPVPANPRHRFIGSSSVLRYDYNGSSAITLPMTTTSSEQDFYGNVKTLVETTTYGDLSWTKTTTNEYDADDKWKRLGRLKKSTVVSTAPSLDQQMAAYPRSPGTSPNATATSSSTPAVPQPIRPEVLMPILQLLLED